MIKSEFPEKMYESLILHELLEFVPRDSNPAICVPSQVLENKIGCDLCFVDSSSSPIKRRVMMIQFKISYEYKRKKDGKHFKFDLFSKNGYEQHNKLCDYNSHGDSVVGLYCAPRFVKYKDLIEKTTNKNLIGDSTFFEPNKKISDKKYHYVCFDSKTATSHSKEAQQYNAVLIREKIQALKPISLDEFKFILDSILKEQENTIYDAYGLRRQINNGFSQYFIFY